jgi:uncharacterized membrane protein
MPREIDERRARQGFWDRPVLYVLVGGLILAAIYLAVLTGWTVFESDSDIADVEVQQTN